VGGLSEMIRHEKDGLLVPPGDVKALAEVIIRLLSDRDLQQQIRTAALLRCQEDLNWSNIAAQTVEVYRKAIDMKSASLVKS
jgi:glycosyltransferase involved in cell wall biosynthesis